MAGLKWTTTPGSFPVRTILLTCGLHKPKESVVQTTLTGHGKNNAYVCFFRLQKKEPVRICCHYDIFHCSRWCISNVGFRRKFEQAKLSALFLITPDSPLSEAKQISSSHSDRIKCLIHAVLFPFRLQNKNGLLAPGRIIPKPLSVSSQWLPAFILIDLNKSDRQETDRTSLNKYLISSYNSSEEAWQHG